VVAQKLQKYITKFVRIEPYSGRSSSITPSCSTTELRRCTTTEIRWNKNDNDQTSPVVSTKDTCRIPYETCPCATKAVSAGCLPSERLRPDGFLDTGTPAEARDLAMTSYRWWCLTVLLMIMMMMIIIIITHLRLIPSVPSPFLSSRPLPSLPILLFYLPQATVPCEARPPNAL